MSICLQIHGWKHGNKYTISKKIVARAFDIALVLDFHFSWIFQVCEKNIVPIQLACFLKPLQSFRHRYKQVCLQLHVSIFCSFQQNRNLNCFKLSRLRGLEGNFSSTLKSFFLLKTNFWNSIRIRFESETSERWLKEALGARMLEFVSLWEYIQSNLSKIA